MPLQTWLKSFFGVRAGLKAGCDFFVLKGVPCLDLQELRQEPVADKVGSKLCVVGQLHFFHQPGAVGVDGFDA